MHDGQCKERKEVLTKYLLWNTSASQSSSSSLPVEVSPTSAANLDPVFIEEHCPMCESWKSGVKAALTNRLGLSATFQEQQLEEDQHSHSFYTEDPGASGTSGFPGLHSFICVHEVTIRVSNTEAASMNCIGLPTGQEFATTEGDFNLTAMQMQCDGDGLHFGTQLNIWTWVRRVEKLPRTSGARSSRRSSRNSKDGSALDEQMLTKMVPLPHDTTHHLVKMSHAGRASMEAQPPSSVLCEVQKGRVTDWPRARRIAE
jgi:hypothetical protein